MATSTLNPAPGATRALKNNQALSTNRKKPATRIFHLAVKLAERFAASFKLKLAITGAGSYRAGKIALLAALLIATSLPAWGQAMGDYRTTDDGDWNNAAIWQRWDGIAWVAPGASGWPGQNPGTGTVSIRDGHDINLTVTPANPVGSLIIVTGGSTSSLTFTGTNALVVTGDINIQAPTSNSVTKHIAINAGTLTGNNLNIVLSTGGNATRDAFAVLTTGVLNVTNNITIAGTDGARSYIRFDGGGTVNVGGTFTGGNITSAAGGGTSAPTAGTVNFNRAGNQTVGSYTYHNLTLSGSGVKSIATSSVTVNGTLSMEGAATASAVPTYGTGATLRYNTATPRTAGPEWPAAFTPTGGVVIANTGAISLNEAKVMGLNAPLTINSGASFATNNHQLTLGGNFVNNGTANFGSSNIVIANTAATQTIGSITTTGTVSMTKTSGTATLVWNLNAANLIINGAGGTLNLGSGFTHTITGTWTRTAGTLHGGSSVLRLMGLTPVSGTGGTFTAGTGNIAYAAAGNQDVAALVYHTLSVGGGGTKTLQGATTVHSLSVGAATTLVTQQHTLTGNAGGVFTMADGATLRLGLPGNPANVFPANFTAANTTLHANSTVVYQAGGAQSVLAATYGHLVIDGGNIKTIQGSARVNSSLTLVNGNLSTGSGANNLTLGPTATLSATGGFGPTRMIQCDGTGLLVVEGTSPARFAMIYPVGTAGAFTPMEITGFSGTVAGTGSVGVRVAATTAPGANATDLRRHWVTTGTNLGAINANVRFTYLPGDISPTGNGAEYQAWFHDGAGWSEPSVRTAAGVNPFGADGVGSLSGTWTAREPIVTLYSYQSGPWNVATTWTTDPSGTLSVSPAVPSAFDRVVILNGREVHLPANNVVVSSAELREGGVLDLRTTTGHNLGTVTGQGLLRLASNNFPAGDFAQFVAANGGTVEYSNLNNTSLSTTQLTYNNLVISNSTTTNQSVFLANSTNNITYVVNGNFELRATSTGTLTFSYGNPVASDNLISKTVRGNYTVGTGTNVRVNNFATERSTPNPPAGGPVAEYSIHELYLHGNLTNNGSIRFTGLPSPAVNAYYLLTTNRFGGINHGAVEVTFRGASNNTLTLNGVTDFYRLVVDKGTDNTFVLEVNSSSTANFALYGPNNQGNNSFAGGPEGFGIGAYHKALFIRAGTLKLNDNILIPSLTEGGQDFNLLPTAGLWVNGAQVFTTLTDNGTGWQAATVYGNLRISSGSFSTRNSAGIVLGTLGTPTFLLEGTGTLDVSQMWAAEGGGNVITWHQTGGTANIRMQGESQGGAMLSLANPSNAFIMTGGTLNFTDVTFVGGGTNTAIMDLRSAPGNFTVSGDAVINFNLPSGHTYTVNTTVPFGNLNISRRTGTGGLTIRFLNTSGSNVNVLNNLVVDDNTTLDLGTNTMNLVVGGNFTLAAGATYTPGINSTTFNGSGPQAFSNLGTITTGLNHLALANRADVTIGANLALRGNLTIGSGTTLRDNGRVVTVGGNIDISGAHFRPETGAGRLELTGTAAQLITGNGNGVFNNLSINKTGGTVTLQTPVTINGDLRLVTNHRLDIGNHELRLGPAANIFSAATGNAQVFASNKMIATGGLMSNGGIRREFSATSPSFTFPYGFAIGATFYYLPATINFTAAPAQWGAVTSRPVNSRHHLAQGATNALTMYWKTNSSDFTGIPAGSVVHQYTYTDFFVQGSESGYIPAVYSYGIAWRTINDVNLVNEATNLVTFNAESDANGDFTAGLPTAFTGIPVLFSRANGNWNATSTWSTEGHTGPAATITPTANSIVNIGPGHTVTMTANGAVAGALFIADGAVLDLVATQGHNFAAIPEEGITGRGTLRIGSSNYFPRGDFGEFIGPNGGTVEYYTITGDLTIPVTSDVTGLQLNRYFNLVLNHSGSQSIVLPNTDLTIRGNLTIRGAGTGQASTNTTAARAINVLGNLDVVSGTLRYSNAVATTIRVHGDVNVASGASFTVFDGGTPVDNILELHGNLNNSGIFNMVGGTRRAITRFAGTSNTAIAGAGPTYNFFRVEVNKGVDPAFAVNLTSAITTTGGATPFLVLQNGTFRVDNPALDVIFTTTDFTIPATAALSVINGTARVAHGGGNLLLAGRLEVLGGRMFIGNPAQDQSNSIEYAAAGRPEIVVRGGELNVNGQIRRATTITSGALNYTQSGGVVTILGRQRNGTRALLEVLNTNSHFAMSDGTLLFARPSAAGTTSGDVVITPSSSAVTGGTVQLGADNNAAGYTFVFQSSAPLWNLVTGANTGQDARLEVLPLVIFNNLTINSSSHFRANGHNVTLGGNLVNLNSSATAGINAGGFQPGTTNQTVTLNGGGARQISGLGGNLTNFANLVIASADTLTLQPATRLRVNGNLSLATGVLNDGGQSIEVAGNITNTASHTSPATSGGLVLSGTVSQVLSGSGGQFGNIIMNSLAGASLQNNMTINGRLTFNQGSLYINDYLLTFGIDASIGGTPDRARMIILNGVLSDQGVRRLFDSGASPEFLFPVGVAGKYTPAAYTILANSAPGSITLRPVNTRHATLATIAGGATDELAYYWSVNAEGFAGLSVRHTYRYVEDDVRGTESSYVGGRYVVETYTWHNLGSVVDAAANTISFVASEITGEYTAGHPSNFVAIPVLYSRTSGNWGDANTWSLTPGGATCGCTPNGHPVVIMAGHTVTLNSNSALAYSVEVTGTLDAGTTLFHNLGHVFGTGALALTSTPDGIFVVPGGRFDDFFDNPSTTIEFRGGNPANLPLKPGNIYKPYQNVIFSGAGTKNISAEDMSINGNLIIRAGTRLSNVNFNRDIHISGNWVNENTVANGFIPGRGTVHFVGNREQLFNVRVTENFFNVALNTTGILDMAPTANGASLAVANQLHLTRGIIRSYDNRVVHITNTAMNAISGGNTLSFVDGPLRKSIIMGQSFTFHVGQGTRHGQIALLNTDGGTSPADWTARYFNSNPFPRDPANLNLPITSVSNNEHWVVTRPTGASANISLRWDANSYPGVTTDAALRNRLRVVQYNGGDTRWSERGQTINHVAGTVSTTTRVTANDYIFTLGLSGVTATISDLTTVTICNDGSVASIPVALTGSAPWSLTYRVTGTITRDFTQTGITSPNYLIQFTGADLAGAGNYHVSLVSVSDPSGAGIVTAGSVNLVVQQTFVPVISGASMVGTSETRAFSTPRNGSNTYAWSWVGAAGGTISTPLNHSTNVVFGTTPGTFQLQVVETTHSTGCSAASIFSVQVTNVPVPVITPVQPNICIGSAITYSTAAITGNQYRWTVTGGTVQTPNAGNWRDVASGGNTISVLWGVAGNGTVRVEERVGAGPTQGQAEEAVVVSPAVNARVVTSLSGEVCHGTGTFIRVAASESGVTYRLRNMTTGAWVGPSQGGTGTDLDLPTGELLTSQSPYTFEVVAFNLACEVVLANKPVVTVLPQPVVTLVSDAPGNIFCSGLPVAFTATAGFSNYAFRVSGVTVQSGTGNQFVASTLVNGSAVEVVVTNAQGCQGSSTALNMILNSVDGVWIGSVSNDVTNPANWCNGLLPAANNLVVSSRMINQPRLNGDVTLSGLAIEAGASIAIGEGARVTLNGPLANEGELVINNATGHGGLASFIHNGVQTGAGVARVRLTLPRDTWYYLSHPVANARTGIYDVRMPGSTEANFRDFSNVSFFRNNQWFRVTGINTALRPLEGLAARYNPVDPLATTHTLNFTGVLNHEAVTRVFAEAGFHLLGNPYPAFISWQDDSGWAARANLMGTIWYRSRVNGEMGFSIYNRFAPEGARVAVFPDGVTPGDEAQMAMIPPLQSVWIRTLAPNSEVTVSPQARNHGTPGAMLKSASAAARADIVRVTAENSRSRDGAVIYFMNGAVTGFDPGDSEKRHSDSEFIPEVFTRQGTTPLAINGLPALGDSSKVIPLSVRNRVEGNVTLNFNMERFHGQHAVYLEDAVTGTFTHVTRGGSYTYTATAAGDVHDRFRLHFYLVPTSLGQEVEESQPGGGINIMSMGNKVLVSFSNALLQQDGVGNIELYTIEGRLVSQIEARNSRTVIILPAETGIYIVRAFAGGVVKSEKVINSGPR